MKHLILDVDAAAGGERAGLARICRRRFRDTLFCAEQFRANPREVQVRERPHRAVETLLEQDRLNVVACQEDDGSFQHRKHRLSFVAAKQTSHHGLNFDAGEADGIEVGW